MHNSADIYGASRCLLRLCVALDRTRYEPIVLLPEDGPLVRLLREKGIELLIDSRVSIVTRRVFKSWRVLPFLLDIPRAAWRLRNIIRRYRIDLVHTNVGIILSSGLGARFAGVSHIWHIRDWYGEFRGLWRLYRRYILACSEQVICVSRAIAAQFPEEPKVTVIHDGFSLSEFDLDQAQLRAEFRERYGISRQCLVIGAVGRLKLVRKGQEFLIRAAALLRDQGFAFRLLIVGSPSPGSEDHLPKLQRLAAELDLIDRVIFTGELSDARPAYAALDIFVLPSAQPEPFGGVVIEAMAMAKPVVATAIGGSLDQVVDGQSGYLVPPADPKALAEKLALLLEDPTLREQMGKAGQQRVRSQFDFEAMIRRIEKTYGAVLPR